MTTGAFSERRLGDHLLVAQLSEDCLGTAFRALHSNDDNRFLRLRILQSPELSPPDVFDAVRTNARWVSSLSHKCIVQRAELGIADGVPFVAWQESAGWTLDLLLARLRATGTQLPVEHALLIAERIAAALEYAWTTPAHGERIRHGLLWPGFISISNDAEVRVGGFGLADGVLPSLRKGRVARDIAPYIAPEVRESGQPGDSAADTYSLGVLLHELLTCRRPTLGPPMADFRSEDPFPPEIRPILERCFAPHEQRFASASEMHRALNELLATTSYYSVSTVSLALFLYKLLNPESHNLPITDAESTNPVEGDLPSPSPESAAAAHGRRVGDRSHLDSPEEKAALADNLLQLMSPSEPAPSSESGPVSGRTDEVVAISRRTRAVFGAAAAMILLILGFWKMRRENPAASVTPVASSAATTTVRPQFSEAPATPTLAPSVQTEASSLRLASAGAHTRDRRSKVKKAAAAAPAQDARLVPAAQISSDERRSAEGLRFEAGIARIEAERLEAHELASSEFTEAKSREREGEELFLMQSYQRAGAAFDRAAALYRLSENISRERRVERVKIASD
jgi:serine/threonine-protein kinase